MTWCQFLTKSGSYSDGEQICDTNIHEEDSSFGDTKYSGASDVLKIDENVCVSIWEKLHGIENRANTAADDQIDSEMDWGSEELDVLLMVIIVMITL